MQYEVGRVIQFHENTVENKPVNIDYACHLMGSWKLW